MIDSMDPYRSVADYDREEARSAARFAEEPEPGPTLADVEDRPPDYLEEDGVHHPPWCTKPPFHHEQGEECSPR